MALGNRYTFTFQSLIDGEDFTILIKQEGYVGTVETLQYLPGRSPVVLSYDKNNSNLLHPIRGAQLTVRVSLTPEQIQEFVLAENRDWYCELTGENGFEWYGWMQPQNSVVYSPYGLRQLDLQFSDNLGALQNTPDSVLDSAFIEKQSLATMIERLLSYTDINLPVTIETSVYHADQSPTTAEDGVFLEQVMSLDYNGQQPQSAYDLLSKILRLLHCVVYQKSGNWVVENLIDKSLAPYPVDLFTNYQPLDRSLQVRFESPLSKVMATSYHYQIRHAIPNRDFSDFNNIIGFFFWEQAPVTTDQIWDTVTVSGKRFLEIQGNYQPAVGTSNEYYVNDGGAVTEGEAVRVFLQYDYSTYGAGTTNPRVAVYLDSAGTPYYLRGDNVWDQTATPYILTGDAEIAGVLNAETLAPATGTITIRIYRPDVPSTGTSYFPNNPYIRFGFADVLASKTANPEDYKLFRSVGFKDNRGLREDEKFDTIGLAFDREFSPNGAAFFQFEQYVSFIYDSAGDRLSGDFLSDYMTVSQPWGLTEFASNTMMRLLGKPQIYIEVTLRGKGLYIGDVYEVEIPGFAEPYLFVVVAYDYDVKSDNYAAVLAYISYDATDTITIQRFWLQQSQDDPDA